MRARHERIAGSLDDDVLQIPIDELEDEVDDLDPDRCYVVQCVSGLYSRQAVRELTDAGVHEVYNLAGGVGR